MTNVRQLIEELQLSLEDPRGQLAVIHQQEVSSPTGGGSALAQTFSPLDYQAVGDGVTDDTAALNSVVAAAGAVGGRVLFPAGKTFLLTGNVTVASTCSLDFQGSTLKKKSTMNGSAFVVTAANVEVFRLNVDGNRSAGALGNGISWRATGGKLWDSKVTSTTGQGVNVQTTAGSSLECHNVTSTDNVSGSSLGRGFYCASGMTLKLYQCVASSNDENGVLIDVGANTDCFLDVETTGNSRAGVSIRNQGGKGGTVWCHDDARYGLVFEKNGPAYWVIDNVITEEIGKTAVNVSGTGLEFLGATDCVVKSHVARGCLGYCVAFAYESTVGATNQAAKRNKVLTCFYDRVGPSGSAADSDAAIHISGGSQYNYVGPGKVGRVTVATMIGEGYNSVGQLSSSGTAAANDFNVIGPLTCDGLTFALSVIDSGSRNTIMYSSGRDNVTSGSGNLTNYWEALVNFVNFHQTASPRTDPVKNNRVFVFGELSSPSGTKPVYVVKADNDTANITGNVVEIASTNSDYQTGRWSDVGAVNAPLWRIDGMKMGLPLRRWIVPYVGIGTTSSAFTAGQVLLVQFDVTEYSIVDAISYTKGTAVSGNLTVGIIGPAVTEDTAAGAPVAVQSASTAQSAGSATEQIVTFTPTVLAPGRYWAAIEADNATGTFSRVASANYAAGWGQSYTQTYGALASTTPAVAALAAAPSLRVRLAAA